MIVTIGLVILLIAGLVAAVGVLGNSGTAHPLNDPFSVFGYHVTGSTGTLFVFGMVTGAVAMLGLSVLLAGARRTEAIRTPGGTSTHRRSGTDQPPPLNRHQQRHPTSNINTHKRKDT